MILLVTSIGRISKEFHNAIQFLYHIRLIFHTFSEVDGGREVVKDIAIGIETFCSSFCTHTTIPSTTTSTTSTTTAVAVATRKAGIKIAVVVCGRGLGIILCK